MIPTWYSDRRKKRRITDVFPVAWFQRHISAHSRFAFLHTGLHFSHLCIRSSTCSCALTTWTTAHPYTPLPLPLMPACLLRPAEECEQITDS